MKLISNSNFGKSNLLFYLLLVKEQYYINENPLKEKWKKLWFGIDNITWK